MYDDNLNLKEIFHSLQAVTGVASYTEVMRLNGTPQTTFQGRGFSYLLKRKADKRGRGREQTTRATAGLTGILY